MIRSLALLATALLVAGIVTSANADEDIPSSPPTFTVDERAKLDAGDPVMREERFNDAKGQRAGKAIAYIRVNAAPTKIWDVILDFDRYAEFYPNLSESALTSHAGTEYQARFLLNVLGLLRLRYHVIHTYMPERNAMTWKMDQTKKNDFKETTGFWKIWPEDGGRSLVCYSVYIEAGRGVPKFAEDFADKLGLTTWGLKKVVVSLKKRVEIGSAFKGDGDHPEGANIAEPTP